MSKLNKEFYYKGYRFNTSIELNTKVERILDGKVWHTIITNCMDGNNYYQKEVIETSQIEEYVQKHNKSAEEYIDKLTYTQQSYEEQLLYKLGFS